jgi:acetolactate synthase-1/2/3 large subunit
MPKTGAAHPFIEGLCDLGIEYLFCNLGTDHVSIVEELARRRQRGLAYPQPILCPHENVAVHMAGGYAAMTGRGQAVLVHVDAGTANSAMAMHNLSRARLPVFLMAGRAPWSSHGERRGGRDNFVHFIQDPYDIGSLVRPYVKWEYCLPSGVVAREVLRRGHTLMQSDPPGPVFLTLPREVLAEELDEDASPAFPAERYGPLNRGGADAATVARLAEALMAAENPLLITAYAGRNPAAAPLLDQLARLAGLRVVEFVPAFLNIARDSPCHLGGDPHALAPDADLGLLLDVDVPWIPQQLHAPLKGRWLHVDADPVKSGLPMWSFPAELRVQADAATLLAQLIEAVRARADDAFHARIAARIASWAPARAARARRLADAAATPGEPDAITPAFLCAALARALAPGDIVLNEAIRNGPVVQDHIPRSEPGTWLGLAGGGLGFSGGMALGVKLARRELRVVQVVGDGSFQFGTPDSVYAVAQAHGLPILTVVLDNRGWSAVKEATRRVYPDGAAAQTDDYCARLDAAPERRFEDIARAFGGHGERVVTADQVEGAIARCLAALESGRSAVLTARVTPL